MYEATKRAKVFESTMFNQLKDELEKIIPLPSIFDLSFLHLIKKVELIILFLVLSKNN